MRFDWDENNEGHIARHGIDVVEWESAFMDVHRRGRPTHAGPERRRALLGRTLSGRLLFIVYTYRDGAVRPVTAREATFRERRAYRAK